MPNDTLFIKKILSRTLALQYVDIKVHCNYLFNSIISYNGILVNAGANVFSHNNR
jgi:hypothetical protein